ncbi:MAG: GTP-binding protein [archaeon]|nr:GTP-binding protein [archaeon]
MGDQFDYTFKILMLGDASVGKTSLSERYITGVFNPDLRLTVGVEFFIKTVNIHGKRIKLQIWDMGGEDRFRFLLPTYCLGSSGAIFMYDNTRPSTLQHIEDWTSIFKEKNGNDIPILLVGNKIDLEEHREIPREEGIKIAKQNKMAGFVESSAKEGINVEKTFQTLTNLMVKNMLKMED